MVNFRQGGNIVVQLIKHNVKLREIKYNLPYVKLYDEEESGNEGVFTNNNTFIVDTRKFTGRSPKDKWIVKQRHQKQCKSNDRVFDLESKLAQAEKDIEMYKKDILQKTIVIQEKNSQIEKLQDKLENIALQAVKRPFEDETIIDIDDDFLSDSDFTIEESDNEEEYKQLQPLEVGKGFTIEHREEDGYINVTNLCKAGNKKFYGWHRLDKTKAFLRLLSLEAQICATKLIKLGSGSKNIKNSTRETWVHPQVAINIAQWISPAFDLKVSGWVYEIMMTGKVDITNTTSFKKLQEENKGHKLRIQYLTKKYVKSQPREQYKEKYVIYILTTALMKKERRYILGKATNLTHRLSTYNKSDEHEVVFYQECGDEETMTLVENMVFHQLEEYREQANRERFILPKTEEINFFSEKINKSVNFFKK